MTKNPPWQLLTPLDAIVFDCDGTLSQIEGIDELAKLNNVGAQVEQLTATAMGQTGINASLYEQRLKLVKPSYQQVVTIGQAYIEHATADVIAVIKILKSLGKNLYIVSAGILPSVAIFAHYLGIETSNIYAVDLIFDEHHQYQDFDRHSLLVTPNGKPAIVEQIKQDHPKIAHIGDGMNDYAAHDIVSRFIGYGGAYYRENLAQLCPYYFCAATLLPLLPLCLTLEEIARLDPAAQKLCHDGLWILTQDKIFSKKMLP